MITKEDLINLEGVFLLARNASTKDEQLLLNLINFKKRLFEEIEKLSSIKEDIKE